MKKLASEFQAQFECFGENTENYKTFSVPIEEQVINIDKDGNENLGTIYILQNEIY